MTKFLAFILALGISIGVHAEKMAPHLYGRWKIIGVADAQESTSLSSDQVDLLTGTELIIAPKYVRFNGQVCKKPNYTLTRQHTQTFFRKSYVLDPKNLLLPDDVLEIQTNCENPTEINFIYVQNKRKIIFYWKGFFLRAAM